MGVNRFARALFRESIYLIESGVTGRGAGMGLYDWPEKDLADSRCRKQAPFFDGVKEWSLPK